MPLNGVKTLRYTVEANGGDINYLMLCKAGCDEIKFSRDGNGNLVLTWGSAGALQCRTSLTADSSWQNVAGATSPYTITPGGANGPTRYYRINCGQ